MAKNEKIVNMYFHIVRSKPISKIVLEHHDYVYWQKRTLKKGSAIFIHLTKRYNVTAGCIALIEKDFLILARLINKNTKIKIS